jgi:hypothetical protein
MVNIPGLILLIIVVIVALYFNDKNLEAKDPEGKT